MPSLTLTLTSLLVTLNSLPGADGIQCYVCEDVATNHMCVSEFSLQRCDSGRFDTCQTIVAYSDVSEKLSITKSCATNNSCTLQQKGTPKTPCVLTNPVWVCTSCCHTDACNYNNAIAIHSYHGISFPRFALFVVAVICTSQGYRFWLM